MEEKAKRYVYPDEILNKAREPIEKMLSLS